MTFATICAAVLLCTMPGSRLFGIEAQEAKPSPTATSPKERVDRLTLSREEPTIRKGEVQGYDNQSYLVSGGHGQKLRVSLQSTNASLYFNLRRAESAEALHASDRAETGNTGEVILPADGDYRVDVYLFRSAARRGSKAPFMITLTVNE